MRDEDLQLLTEHQLYALVRERMSFGGGSIALFTPGTRQTVILYYTRLFDRTVTIVVKLSGTIDRDWIDKFREISKLISPEAAKQQVSEDFGWRYYYIEVAFDGTVFKPAHIAMLTLIRELENHGLVERQNDS